MPHTIPPIVVEIPEAVEPDLEQQRPVESAIDCLESVENEENEIDRLETGSCHSEATTYHSQTASDYLEFFGNLIDNVETSSFNSEATSYYSQATFDHLDLIDSVDGALVASNHSDTASIRSETTSIRSETSSSYSPNMISYSPDIGGYSAEIFTASEMKAGNSRNVNYLPDNSIPSTSNYMNSRVVSSNEKKAESLRENALNSLFTMPSFAYGLDKQECTVYMAVHRYTASIVAFGKYLGPSRDFGRCIENLSVINLDDLLSPRLIKFLKLAIPPTNDFIMLPVEIPFKTIQSAPETLDGLIGCLLQEKWVLLINQFDREHNMERIEVLGNLISIMTELKKSDKFMKEISRSTVLSSFELMQCSLANETGVRMFGNDSLTSKFDKCLKLNEPICSLANPKCNSRNGTQACLCDRGVLNQGGLNQGGLNQGGFVVSKPMTNSMKSTNQCNVSKQYLLRAMMNRINRLPDNIPDLIYGLKILDEATQMNRIDPTYTVDQYISFITKNQQKCKTDSSTHKTIKSKRLHVSNIPFRWNEEHLKDEFKRFGEIDHCTVIRTSDQSNGQIESASIHSTQTQSNNLTQKSPIRSRGYGFITFHSEENAEIAKFAKHGTWVCDLDVNGQKFYNPESNRKIEVNYATPRNQK